MFVDTYNEATFRGSLTNECVTSTPSNFAVRFYSPTTGIVVIRYGRDFHKLATAAIASVTAVKAAPVCIHGVHVCGMLQAVPAETIVTPPVPTTIVPFTTGSQRTLASAITRITKEQCDNIGIPFKGTPLLELAKGFTSIEGNTTQ